MLSCNAVRDLMPSYLEHLTSPETDAEMEEHLSGCPACREIRDAMSEEVTLEPAPKSRLDFFKSLHRKQIIGAVLSAVITLLCMYALYNGEFAVDVSSTVTLEAAIDRYFFNDEVDADILESRIVGDRLLVFFLREGYEGHYGTAVLEPGIFGKYRFLNADLYTSGLYVNRTLRTAGKDYLLICGINDLPGVAAYGVYSGLSPDAEPVYQGTVESAPFLRVAEFENADSLGIGLIRYFDADGNEISENALEEAVPDAAQGSAGGVGTAETGLIYGFLLIVLVFGLVMIRYFLIF